MNDRLPLLLVWGGGIIVAFGIVLFKRIRTLRRHRNDRRKAVRRDVRRDVISGFALFLAALGAAGAVAFVLLGEAGSGPRTFALGLALGGFLGAGIVMATEEDANGMT